MSVLDPTENETLAQIDDVRMLDQVRDWSAINSGSRNLDGLGTIAAHLADGFATLPGELELRAPAPVESMGADGSLVPVDHGANLHLKVRADAPVQFLLTGHMDTVFGADHPFQTVFWRADGALGGPGVADMKGGIAVMLAALQALEASPLANGIGYEVVINSDEEVGSPGSAALLAEAARGKLAAFTYEPSALPDGTLAGARPGSGNFSLFVQGKSAHAGRNPEDGRNAVIAAAALALRLDGLRRDGLKVNVGRIDGGGPSNVVPDRAVLRVNLRPTTPEDEAAAAHAIEDSVASIAREHDVAIIPHGCFGRPPKPMDDRALRLFELVRRCGDDLGQAIAWRATGGVCDGNNIAATGVPVVDTLGVRGGAIHSDEEFLIVDSLAERARLSALALLRLAKGEAV